MKHYVLTVIVLIASTWILPGQERTPEEFRDQHTQGMIGEMKRMRGFLNESAPIEILYTDQEGECFGFMKFASASNTIPLEGSCSKSTVELFEFDQHARVTGVIKSNKEEDANTFIWSNYDHSLNLPITVEHLSNPESKIGVYKSEKDQQNVLLWRDRGILKEHSYGQYTLEWTPFSCSQAPYACTSEFGNGDMKNLSISDRTVSVDDDLYRLQENITVQSMDGHGFDYLYHFNFPAIQENDFNEYMSDIVQQELDAFIKQVDSDESSEKEPNERWTKRALGDFFLSLVDENIISGYLTFYSTFNPRMKTIPFTFDRAKKRFYRLKDIWKSDFDFLFYLSTKINNEKRRIISDEVTPVRRILKDDPFGHFNLSSSGLVFFTEHNFIYGRKSILIPYNEIQNFIGDKSLSSLIKQKLK